MPKRVIDFDAMWGSDKLASCAEWAQAEYAWLYGLADASGCFELTNLRVIWGRVAAIRRNLTIERLEQIFGEFQDKGLLFVWEHEGKRYGHWTGSDVPGRLPPPSWRMRLERLAPPVPKKLFAEYVSRFARGRAVLAGGGFCGEALTGKFEMAEVGGRCADARLESSDVEAQRSDSNGQSLAGKLEISDLKVEMAESRAESSIGKSETLDLKVEISDLRLAGTAAGTQRRDNSSEQPSQDLRLAAEREGSVKGGVEEGQAQDWNWNRNMERGRKVEAAVRGAGGGETLQRREMLSQPPFSCANSKPETAGTLRQDASSSTANRLARSVAAGAVSATPEFQARDKSSLVARELLVGRGPVCGPGRVRPEILERIRAREAARKGSRSP